MTLSRWRRVATGLAAGIIVLCAALLGGALRSDSAGVSVASDLRPTNVIQIEDDPVAAEDSVVSGDQGEVEDSGDNQNDPNEDDPESADSQQDDRTVETDDDARPSNNRTTDDAATGPEDNAEPDGSDDSAVDSDPVRVIDEDALAAGGEDSAPANSADAADDAESANSAGDEATSDASTEPAPAPATPPAPVAPAAGLGTGGGVDDSECALDRLVIYAGARRGGVAGSIRAALASAGFGAGCAQPPVVLASNCPLQFSGVLSPNSGYDPNKSYVASSPAVDRSTMTSVMGSVGYAGAEIDILDFGFVNPDKPGEQWMAIFLPPSFAGWEQLANRAGLAPTNAGLCSASGRLAG